MTWKRLHPSVLILGIMLTVCALLWPADPKPSPTITLEQQAEWLQARAELAEARLALKNAEARMNQIVKEIQGVCPATLNSAGRPECPKPAEAPTK